MTNPFQINNKLEAAPATTAEQTGANLYECAYSPHDAKQLGPKIKHFLEVTRELADIGHGKFSEKDAQDVEHIYDQAKKQPHANKESVTKALEERATELNEKLQKQHINARVEVVSGKGLGYDDGSYAFKVEQFDNKTGDTHVIGYVKIGNPKNPGQPIEEKTN
jgi:hypothetical protein